MFSYPFRVILVTAAVIVSKMSTVKPVLRDHGRDTAGLKISL